MSTKLGLILLVLSLLCSQASAQKGAIAASPSNITSNPIYILHVTIINTETGEQEEDRTVIISGERISEVKQSKDVRPPTGAKVIDAKSKYLIPGL